MLEKYLKEILPRSKNNFLKAQLRWDSLAKPLKGMGLLEDYISIIAAMNEKLDITKKAVAVLCADNGIVAQNVTQTGSEVTAIVAKNITNGMATISNMAKISKADVFVYDLGMNSTVGGKVIDKSIAKGTQDFSKAPAMTNEQAIKAIITGIEIVSELKADGYKIIASGEMGIGNTTTSSAITAVLLNLPPSLVTGKGAGLSQEGISHKARVIQAAIAVLKPNPQEPIDVLAKLGGFDIAGIVGLFIGGAYYNIPIIIDGFISSVAALIAYRLCPNTKDYMLASHTSGEPAAKLVLEEIGLSALLHCNMALGEGTGAVAIMPLLDMAAQVYKNMPTFNDTTIEEYKPL